MTQSNAKKRKVSQSGLASFNNLPNILMANARHLTCRLICRERRFKKESGKSC